MSDFSEFEERVSRVMDRFEAKLDALSEHVREIREAQIRLDAKDHSGTGLAEELKAKIVAIEVRLLAMETSASKQSGVFAALEWAYKLGPWILLTAIAVSSYYREWF